MFDRYLDRWGLLPDGEPIETRNSRLLPVRYRGVPAMLKIAVEPEEKFGAALMAWWDGGGAARVLARDDEALLLERAAGAMSLADLARSGRDDEATRLICATVARLHAPRPAAPPDLIPLNQWFRALEPAAAAQGGILTTCAEAARALLAAPREIAVLHGDIHHDNILDFDIGGWLAIDPKGLQGERAFDYANLFCNPDPATAATHFAQRLAIVAAEARLERRRLATWILAWAGLSAAWFIEDGASPEAPLKIAELAAAEARREALCPFV